MTIRSPNLRRAFTLTEVMVAVSLLVFFFAAAGQVFKSTMMLGYNTPRLSNQASQIDSAIFQLRRDVWSSREISVTKPNTADLDTPDGKISWTIDSDGDLKRTDSHGQPERWTAIARNWSLAADETCLTVGDGSSDMRLPSQILLARGAQP